MATNPVDEAKAAIAAAAASAAVKSAATSLESGANQALDAVEKLLFGKVGGAAESLDDNRSALDRLRAQAGLEPSSTAPARPVEDPVAVARAQLDELKKARNASRDAEPETTPNKKTL